MVTFPRSSDKAWRVSRSLAGVPRLVRAGSVLHVTVQNVVSDKDDMIYTYADGRRSLLVFAINRAVVDYSCSPAEHAL